MERFAFMARLSVRLGASIAAAAGFLAFATSSAWAAIGVPAQVADINPGPGGSSVVSTEPFGRSIIFRGSNPTVGDEPWISDGTAAGTVPLEVQPGPLNSFPGSFTAIGDVVVFLAVGPGGDELWRTDGTAAGTTQVLDINPGPASSNPRGFLGLGDQVVFRADDGAAGTEPWRTDGTAAGTSRIADVNPGPAGGANTFFPARMGDQVFFRGSEPVAGAELWRFPVTGPGAELVANIALAGGSGPRELTPLGDTLYFLADDAIVGEELWRSDGEPGGDYALVDDFDNAATDSGVTALTAFRSHVYFRVDGDGNGIELWRADETGAEIVRDINPVGDSTPQNLTPIGDWLYFTAVGQGTGRELWRSDGIPGGTTEMVADINPGGSSMCGFPSFLPIGDTIYFCANDGSSGLELWRTDGTPAGTARVGDINPGPPGSAPSALTVLGDTLYFSATDGASGTELWAVDTGRPDTAVVSGPAAGSRIADRTPSFQLSSTALDLARFECSPSGEDGTFTPCADRDGAAQLARLDDGDHLLSFRAVDVRDNNDRDHAQVPVTVDGTAPRVVVKGKRLKLDGRGKVKLKALCKRSEKSGPCRGKVVLKTTKGKAKVGKQKFKLKPGKAKRLKVKIKPSKLARLERAGAVRAQGNARDRLGNKRTFRSKKLKVRLP